MPPAGLLALRRSGSVVLAPVFVVFMAALAGGSMRSRATALRAGQGPLYRPLLQEAEQERAEQSQHRDGGDRQGP